MAEKVHIDKNALSKILNSSEVESGAQKVGDGVAENARPHLQKPDAECDCRMYKTTFGGMKGPVAVVALKHPIGKRIEAKYGPLQKGAAAKGLKVRDRHAE
jgi:hypothetical protein